jgi:hypothetical protein
VENNEDDDKWKDLEENDKIEPVHFENVEKSQNYRDYSTEFIINAYPLLLRKTIALGRILSLRKSAHSV